LPAGAVSSGAVAAEGGRVEGLTNVLPPGPAWSKNKREINVQEIGREFKEIERVHKIPPGDFPEVRKMQELLQPHDFSTFESKSDRLFEQMNLVLTIELPKLMKTLAPPKKKRA